MPISVALEIGDSALSRLEDPGFVAEWGALSDRCPWATSFQSFAFVECWYRLHRQRYEPVIVEGRDKTGRLVGLLTLARPLAGHVLVGAGAIHAEYQGWIADEGLTPSFVTASLDLLEDSFPRGRLRFNYLPPRTPLAWVDGDRRWPRRINVRSHSAGYIDLSDPAPLDASLRKGHNRSRLNSLRRSGDVKLETIDTLEGLERDIDEIATLCDLRQGAVNDSLPFADPLKRPLHLGLMEQGLLHATILRVGSAIASAHLDMKNGNDVLIYLIAHAPAYARQSPGSLHILLLARELADMGVARYDLSPGGGYKDRFATDREPIYRMSVRFGSVGRVVSDLSARTLATATAGLAAVGETPRSALDRVQHFRARVSGSFSRRGSVKVRVQDSVVLRLPDQPEVRTEPLLGLDHLNDLLAYQASPSTPSMQAFLGLALHRLEIGHRALTRVDDAGLAECWWACWIGQPPGDRSKGARADISNASKVLVYDPVVRASRAGSVPGQEILNRLVTTIRAIAPGARSFLAVSPTEVELIELLIEAGTGRVRKETEPLPNDLLMMLAKGWSTDLVDSA